MVTKREFNRIKRENPESPIGQRDWEEEKTRNDLYKAIMKSKKKWITHPYIERYKKQLEEKEKLKEIIFQLRPPYFEKIDLLSWIDENKLAELQQADLVLVYRDNNTYKNMSVALKNLVEHLYWWKVYCVSIPQGTEELSDKDKETLKNILKTCNSVTDYTISRWTGIAWTHIPESERYAERIQKFLWITKNLEKKFIERWIDTIYIYVSYRHPYNGGKVWYGLFDHWCMCQRKDWSAYFFGGRFVDHNEKDLFTKDEKSQIIEDAKRFWKNQFPNLNVEFIENHDVKSWGQYKPDNSVLIADRHADMRSKPFLWQKIFFAWVDFEPNGWIENFVDEKAVQYVWNKGEAIAKSVLLNLPNFKNEIKK